LPFADASFDGVWGNAVLHHLDADRAGAELRRVLRPGGLAVFCEPWGGNPFLQLARRRLPYPGKQRTPDEAPLGPADLRALRRHFPRLAWTGHQLLGMLRRIRRLPASLVAGLDALDRRFLSVYPALKNLCRYVVLTLPR
jgi:SAM-dependent methyltransferase